MAAIAATAAFVLPVVGPAPPAAAAGATGVYAWGDNGYGQLGNGTYDASTVATPVAWSGATQLSAGVYHSLAIGRRADVWAWGGNDYGQLGVSGINESLVPVQVTSLSGVIQVAAGWYHSVALKSDGTVWSWGDNSYGQLGNGSTGTGSTTPVQATGLTGVYRIATKADTTYALKSDGTVWAWGASYNGQLGNGDMTVTESNVPVQVTGLTNISEIAAGVYHAVARSIDGSVWTWGYNAFGQLGRTTDTQSTAVAGQVSDLLANRVAAGDYHTVVAKSDGTVVAFGDDENGELGDGVTDSSGDDANIHVVTVSGLTGVTQLAAFDHTLALKSDGTLWSWGYNGYGQVGDGTTNDAFVPVQTKGLLGVTQVSASEYHSLAVAKSLAWGASLALRASRTCEIKATYTWRGFAGSQPTGWWISINGDEQTGAITVGSGRVSASYLATPDPGYLNGWSSEAKLTSADHPDGIPGSFVRAADIQAACS